MNCSWTRRNLHSYIDGELSPAGQGLLRLHLRFCTGCFEAYERQESMTLLTSGLGSVAPPPELRTQINIALSYEAARSWPWNWERLRDRAREFLRPLAVPAVGGVLSALVLLGTLVQDLVQPQKLFLDDVPLMRIAQAPQVDIAAPYALSNDAVVLLFIDRQGDVYDFDFVEDHQNSEKFRSEVANSLLFARFHPARVFGQPVSSTLVVRFTSTTVRG